MFESLFFQIDILAFPALQLFRCYSLVANMKLFFLFQQHAAWIIPFFCYQVFDCALNTLVAVSIVVYPNTIQDYLQQLVRRTPKSNSYSNKVPEMTLYCLYNALDSAPYKELGAILDVATTLFTANLTAADFVCLTVWCHPHSLRTSPTKRTSWP